MKIRFVFLACVLVAVLTSCTKIERNTIENVEPVVDFELEPVQEPIPEPDRFVTAIVLSPSTKLYLQGRDNNMHSILSIKNNATIDILLSNNSDEPETNLENETFLHAVYDSVDFWIPESDIAISSESAVVIFDSTLYEDAQLLSPKN